MRRKRKTCFSRAALLLILVAAFLTASLTVCNIARVQASSLDFLPRVEDFSSHAARVPTGHLPVVPCHCFCPVCPYLSCAPVLTSSVNFVPVVFPIPLLPVPGRAFPYPGTLPPIFHPPNALPLLLCLIE